MRACSLVHKQLPPCVSSCRGWKERAYRSLFPKGTNPICGISHPPRALPPPHWHWGFNYESGGHRYSVWSTSQVRLTRGLGLVPASRVLPLWASYPIPPKLCLLIRKMGYLYYAPLMGPGRISRVLHEEPLAQRPGDR